MTAVLIIFQISTELLSEKWVLLQVNLEIKVN